MNYDFELNEKKFVDVCTSPEIKKLFVECIKKYLDDTGTTDRTYHKDKPPFMYSSYILNFYDDIYYNLDEKKRTIPDVYNEMSKHYKGYIIYGACHWLIPIVMLRVVNILLPDEKWMIRTNHHTHTTIINELNTLIFDPIMYDIDDSKTKGGMSAFIKSDVSYNRITVKRRMVYCELCDREYKYTSYRKHIQTLKHKKYMLWKQPADI
jgi:hypothetical protein